MIYDVVVVGAGIAGLMAAIEAKNKGAKVAVITKGNIIRSNSNMASGGINSVLDTHDTNAIDLHILDTINSAKKLSDPKTVKYMCKRAGKIIVKLEKYGICFDKNKDGTVAQRPFGGGSIKRTCYIGDKTGTAITMTLIKKARSLGVEFLQNHFLMNITSYKGSVSGVCVLRRDDSSVMVYPTKSIVLAGGGYAGIYKGYSTNSTDYTGDTLAVALRAGLSLMDMEFVQFHPTGFKKTSHLVSEAARGEGGYLINSQGERFVDELETRDVIARAINEQIKKGQKVYLDLRHLGEQTIDARLPSLKKSAYIQEGINITHELLEIKPVVHYTMGGIETNFVSTKLDGLFVCGENAANMTHGANRLGGNSLLEGAVFGELAGVEAAKFASQTDLKPIDYNFVIEDIKTVDKILEGETTKNFNAMRTSLGRIMFNKVGILRDEAGLIDALSYVKYLTGESRQLFTMDKSKNNNVELVAILELRNALLVSEAIILSALKRCESRGAHYRSDFANSRVEFEKHIKISYFQNKLLRVDYKKNGLWNKIKNFLTKI